MILYVIYIYVTNSWLYTGTLIRFFCFGSWIGIVLLFLFGFSPGDVTPPDCSCALKWCYSDFGGASWNWSPLFMAESGSVLVAWLLEHAWTCLCCTWMHLHTCTHEQTHIFTPSPTDIQLKPDLFGSLALQTTCNSGKCSTTSPCVLTLWGFLVRSSQDLTSILPVSL